MNTTNNAAIEPDQMIGQLLLTGGSAGMAAELFAQGLVQEYPGAMASGRRDAWAAAAHSIIDFVGNGADYAGCLASDARSMSE